MPFYTPLAPRYSDAPYGAGHCNFTVTEETGAIRVLDEWVRTGRRPDPGAADAAFRPPDGLDLAFRPGPWPAAT